MKLERILEPYVKALTGCTRVRYARRVNCPHCTYGSNQCDVCGGQHYLMEDVDTGEVTTW